MSIRQRSFPALGAAFTGLLILTLGACGDDEPDRDDSTNEITEEGEADVFSMAVGDCLPDPSSATGQVTEVAVVPCDEPHVGEIFFAHDIPDAELPDATAMEAITTEQCLGSNFESFVGMPYDESVLQVSWLVPTADSWEAGDREVLCILVDPAGGVTGSLEGAAR